MAETAEATIPYQPNDGGPETGPDPGGWRAAGAAANTAAATDQLQRAQNPSAEHRSEAGAEGGPIPGADFGQPQPLTQVQLVPHPIRPMRTGLLGVVDKIADALTGVDTPEIYTDGLGNKYVQNRFATKGEQWMRIAGNLASGAAAGLAAGRGRGPGAAGAAGVQAGMQNAQARQQNEQNMTAEARQNNIDNANAQMHRMQLAEATWRASRLEVEANQHDIEFSQGQEDRLLKAGATRLGTTKDPGDIAHLQKANPDLMADLVKNHQLEFVPNYEDGKVAGFTVFKTPQNYRDTLVPAGAEFPTYNNVKGEYVWHKTTDPTTQGQLDDYWTAAGTTAQKFKADQAELEVKEATRKNLESEASARGKELPGKIEETAASTAEKRSTIALNQAKIDKIKTGQLDANGEPNPRFETMAQAFYRGDILPADLKRQAKGAGLDPNEIMGRAFEIANDKGEHLSLPIIEQENKFATSPKTQAALDGIDRVLGVAGSQGYMDQMLSIAREAKLTGWGAGNSLMLWAQRKYGKGPTNTVAKNLQTSIAETRRSIAGLIGNPLLGGGETDKKLEQADEMLGKDPTMENLEGAAEILKNALQTQKTSLIQNNRYLRARYASPAAAAGPAPAAVRQAPPRPAGVPANATWNPQGNNGAGSWQLQ